MQAGQAGDHLVLPTLGTGGGKHVAVVALALTAVPVAVVVATGVEVGDGVVVDLGVALVLAVVNLYTVLSSPSRV